MLGNAMIFRSAHTYKYLHFFGTPLLKNVEIFRTLMLGFARVKTRQQERAKMRFLLVRSCFDGADRAAGTDRIGFSSVWSVKPWGSREAERKRRTARESPGYRGGRLRRKNKTDRPRTRVKYSQNPRARTREVPCWRHKCREHSAKT